MIMRREMCILRMARPFYCILFLFFTCLCPGAAESKLALKPCLLPDQDHGQRPETAAVVSASFVKKQPRKEN